MVGAVAPSSRFVVKKILKELNANALYIVEYGAGDGVITKALLHKLPSSARLVAIETNNAFVEDLKKIKDDRLIIIHDDVVRVAENFTKLNLPRIDTIISGIPFSFFKPSVRNILIKNTVCGITPGGQFIVYQYSIFMYPILKKYFREVKITFEPRNFLPYFIMRAIK